MNTEFVLYARYQKPYVHLEDICEEYFNLCAKKAKQAAVSQQLPVPVVRMSDSRKAPYMVRLKDLAEYLDNRHQMYSDTWEMIKGTRSVE